MQLNKRFKQAYPFLS